MVEVRILKMIRQIKSWFRAVARFFLTGAIIASAEGTSLVGRSGYSPPENSQIWRLRNAIFSTFHERCLRKIDLEYEYGKQLRVTVIKITDSKEDNSIHRLDVSGSTSLRACKGGGGGVRGAAAPLALPSPPLATALWFLKQIMRPKKKWSWSILVKLRIKNIQQAYITIIHRSGGG